MEGITEETQQRMLRWLDRNTAGDLIFDHKPYVAYAVRPVKRIEIKKYTHKDRGGNTISGTFSIAFRCYSPFGRMLHSAYTGTPDAGELIATGILPTTMMPPAPKQTDRQFLLYNPGSERAHTRILLAGDVGNGLEIENTTTGQVCKITGLREGYIPPGAYLDINSETGQVLQVMGEEKELAYQYHDRGYIILAPGSPLVRELRVMFEKDSSILTSPEGLFTPGMVGQFIFLGVVYSSIIGWTHAGKVKGIDYRINGGDGAMVKQAKVTTDSGALNMRADRATGAALVTKIPKGSLVAVLDTSDAAWWRISYTGKTGYAMKQFLTPVSGEPSPADTDTVPGGAVSIAIHCIDSSEAERLLALLKAAKVE